MDRPHDRRAGVACLPGLVVIALACVAAAPVAVADGLALRRVMLSTGGVGYFEYQASVTGDRALELEVRLDQVADVMKSIVVFDDQGGIGTIRLPGREPLREVFREMPFGPDALGSPVALLTALRGAEVTLEGARALTGRIVAVTAEPTALPGDRTVTRHRLGVLTADGLRQAILEETDRLTFTDPRLAGQLDQALAALARHGERDRRRLSLATHGDATRTVHVGYVVAAPLWKTSYRLTFAAATGGDGAAVGALQGWAVLENLSGEDWHEVELTVASGNPVTFRQALYDAYYVDRPEVPVEVLGRVLPSVDQGAFSAARPVADADAAPGRPRLARQEAPMAAVPETALAAAPPPAAARLKAAESREATTQVVFRAPQPVTVANGESLLMPIVARSVPAEPLALYQPNAHPSHPLAAVRLVNDGATGLPPGVLTLYQRPAPDAPVTFVGDARLDALPAGEERLVSYAVDQKVRIARRDRHDRVLSGGRIVDGVFHVRRRVERRTVYSIAGPARERRTLIIEHPRAAGFTLAAPAAAAETAGAWRFRRALAPGAEETLEVVLTRPVEDRIGLVDVAPGRLAVFASADALDARTRQALGEVARLREIEAELVQRRDRLARTAERVVGEQARLRDNLKAVPRDSDLFRRYLDRLAATEDRLEALGRDRAVAETEAEAARRALARFLRTLEL